MNYSDRKIAGHKFAFEFTEDFVFKSCKPSELVFYERLQSNRTQNDDEFIKFIPKYIGHNDN